MREVPPLDETMRTIEAAAAICAEAGVVFQLGPNGPQWCSDPLMRCIAEMSAANGWRVHMHLFETRAQRAWADGTQAGGLLPHLDALGLLSERLTVAHGVWLQGRRKWHFWRRAAPPSWSMPSPTWRLRSGRAPVMAFEQVGLRFALGLDSFSLDDDVDGLRDTCEWRSFSINAHAMVERAARSGAACSRPHSATGLFFGDR